MYKIIEPYKKCFLFSFFMALMVFGVGTSGVHADPIVDVKLLDDYIEVGETFGVEVSVDGQDIGEMLLGFAFDIDFTSSVINPISYTIGDSFVSSSGLSFMDFSFFPDDIYVGGEISDDDVLLATLNFEALTFGSAELTLFGEAMTKGLVYDLNGFDIDYTLPISVHEAASAPVPEPSTMTLLGLGLIGLSGAIRKKLKK